MGSAAIRAMPMMTKVKSTVTRRPVKSAGIISGIAAQSKFIAAHSRRYLHSQLFSHCREERGVLSQTDMRTRNFPRSLPPLSHRGERGEARVRYIPGKA